MVIGRLQGQLNNLTGWLVAACFPGLVEWSLTQAGPYRLLPTRVGGLFARGSPWSCVSPQSRSAAQQAGCELWIVLFGQKLCKSLQAFYHPAPVIVLLRKSQALSHLRQALIHIPQLQKYIPQVA
jgi:hypothetical protein